MALNLTELWQFISVFGNIQFWVWAGVVALIVYIIAPKKTRKSTTWFIFGALPSVAIGWSIAEGLKLLFKIQRPCFGLDFCPTNYSFPSGHAAVIFAAITVAMSYSKSRKLDLPFLALALLVSLSRFFIGMHRIEDIIVGGLIGFVVGFLVYRNYKKILQRVRLNL